MLITDHPAHLSSDATRPLDLFVLSLEKLRGSLLNSPLQSGADKRTWEVADQMEASPALNFHGQDSAVPVCVHSASAGRRPQLTPFSRMMDFLILRQSSTYRSWVRDAMIEQA